MGDMTIRRPGRVPGFAYQGIHRYLLTLCTHRRLRQFESAARVHAVLAQLRRSAALEGFSITAYCFMPDYLHVLAQGRHEDAELRPFMATFKQLTSFSHQRHTGQPLWQVGYSDRVLGTDEDTVDVASYILLNPVRAGLVERPADYPWAGSEAVGRDALPHESVWQR